MNQKRKYIYFSVAVAVIVAVVLFFLIRGGTAGKIASARGLNLLFITLDTTRADHIGAYGYQNGQTPTLDSLARQGVMFENCYTSVPLTLSSHCSIFTGRYPLGHLVRDNGAFFLGENETTLAEKMKENGLADRTFAVISSFVLMSKFGLKQGFDVYDDSLKTDELLNTYDSEIPADQVYAKFSRWFKAQQSQSGNFFAWVHFYDPHVPYNPPPEFQKRFPKSQIGLYDGEIAYTDFQVGKILGDLKLAGVLDKTLVVITGDHGEAFGEHGEFGHALFCYEENLKVPLIFYNTRLFPAGNRVPGRVNLVDIMPTLLDLYGITYPGNMHGTSFITLLDHGQERGERTFYIESMHGQEEMGWAPLTGIIDGPYKYISLPEPELYDLASDANEKVNLFLKKNLLAKTLDKKLQGLVKTYSNRTLSNKTNPYSSRALSETDKKHLQSLGYISAFSGTTSTNLDPKKGILLKNEMEKIDGDIDAGRLDIAEAELDKIIAADPGKCLPQHFGSLNRIYQQTNRQHLVIPNLQKAITVFPKNDNFKINLATEYFKKQQHQEAEQAAVTILKNDDKFTRAYILLAKIRELQDRDIEAVAILEKALLVEPQNVSLKISYAQLLGKTNRLAQAAEICRGLLADPVVTSNNETKSKLAIVLTEIHQDEPAFKLLTEITGAQQDNGEAWNHLGILYFRRGDYQKSLAAYQQSIALADQEAPTYNNLGTLYLTLFLKEKDPRRFGQALDSFNKALALNPDLTSALNGRGSALKFARRLPEALRDWQRAIEIKPSFIDVYFNIAVTYLELHKKKEALIYLQRCKGKFYSQLPPSTQQRLDRLISQASQI